MNGAPNTHKSSPTRTTRYSQHYQKQKQSLWLTITNKPLRADDISNRIQHDDGKHDKFTRSQYRFVWSHRSFTSYLYTYKKNNCTFMSNNRTRSGKQYRCKKWSQRRHKYECKSQIVELAELRWVGPGNNIYAEIAGLGMLSCAQLSWLDEAGLRWTAERDWARLCWAELGWGELNGACFWSSLRF